MDSLRSFFFSKWIEGILSGKMTRLHLFGIFDVMEAGKLSATLHAVGSIQEVSPTSKRNLLSGVDDLHFQVGRVQFPCFQKFAVYSTRDWVLRLKGTKEDIFRDPNLCLDSNMSPQVLSRIASK